MIVIRQAVINTLITYVKVGDNMEYEENCECCQKIVKIVGGYIGSLSNIYCESCGYASEYCGGCWE
jgi:hypothetical protein